MIEDHQTSCLILNYFGHVQGVGMRPFLFRMANELNLRGRIYNHSSGVTADLEGAKANLEDFHKRVIESATKPIVISDCSIRWQNPRGRLGLKIISHTSTTTDTRHTIQPDAATCEKCWADFFDSKSRFFNYPFVTCCECGPRWTTLHRFPFERSNTSYTAFTMCHDCQSEYQNLNSRRFHAQTISCATCGPKITISTSKRSPNDSTFESLQTLILGGGIGLVKGIGGFQLIGDAKNPEAIDRIRVLKSRPSQSLAMMIRDKETFLNMGGTSSDWSRLINPTAPIISIKNLSHPLSHKLAPDLKELGVMAPTTPLHFSLFGNGIDSMVVTSGNPQGNTLPKSREEIQFSLGSAIDFIVDHDREIVHAIDDSVLRGELILRKARGLTPSTHLCHSEPSTPRDPSQEKRNRLALGADLKNAMAIQIDNDFVEFPYCGDLNNRKILETQAHNIREHLKLFGCNLSDLNSSAMDFHPETATQNLVVLGSHSPVPHHLAHAWSAHTECPSELVLTFDGTGYDNHLELGGGDGFVLQNKTWHRVLRLQPIKWVGGNSSVLEPWKSLVLNFASAGVTTDILQSCFSEIPKDLIEVFYSYALGSEGPQTTSMGRWFDAASALIEFGGQQQSYEAQAPIRLEHLAKPFQHNFDITPFVTRINTIDPPLVEINGAAILLELYKLKCLEQISIEHVAFIAHDLMARAVALACHWLEVKTVTGSGGVFQNALFSSQLAFHLNTYRIPFSLPQNIPVNDQSIALGQLYYLEHLHA